VPVLWHGPRRVRSGGNNVVAFPERPRDGPTLH